MSNYCSVHNKLIEDVCEECIVISKSYHKEKYWYCGKHKKKLMPHESCSFCMIDCLLNETNSTMGKWA